MSSELRSTALNTASASSSRPSRLVASLRRSRATAAAITAVTPTSSELTARTWVRSVRVRIAARIGHSSTEPYGGLAATLRAHVSCATCVLERRTPLPTRRCEPAAWAFSNRSPAPHPRSPAAHGGSTPPDRHAMATPRHIDVTTELDDGEDLARARFL